MGLFGKKPNVKQMKDGGDINGLLKALRHYRMEVRRQAAEDLGRLKDTRSAEPLLEALNDRSVEVRSEAMGALRGIWNDRICEAFITLLSDKNAALAKKAATILEEEDWKPRDDEEMLRFLMAKDDWAGMAAQGEYLVEPLIKRLTNPKVDDAVKWAVTFTLHYIDTPFTVRSLMKLTGDSVYYALMALEDKTSEIDTVVKYMINILRGGQFQGDVARTLPTLGIASLGPLAEIVMADKKNESLYTRVWALRALVNLLARTGDARARDVLYRIPVPPEVQALRLDQITDFPGNEHGFYLTTAVFRLCFENPPESLIAATKSRLVSARALGSLALSNYLDPAIMQVIVSGLKDSNKEIVYMTCLALAKIGNKEAARALAALSGHDNEDIRRCAAQALGSCTASAAEETLLGMTGDSSLPVRAQAMLSLAKIKSSRVSR